MGGVTEPKNAETVNSALNSVQILSVSLKATANALVQRLAGHGNKGGPTGPLLTAGTGNVLERLLTLREDLSETQGLINACLQELSVEKSL